MSTTKYPIIGINPAMTTCTYISFYGNTGQMRIIDVESLAITA